MRKICTLCMLAVALTGCASIDPTKVYLQLDSVPSGAMLYYDSTAYGTLPRTLTFDKSGQLPKMKTSTFTAYWPSGAKVSTGLILNRDKKNTYVFRRPMDAAGLEGDMQNERSIQAAQEADRREANRAMAESLSNFTDALEKRNKRSSSTVRCIRTDPGVALCDEM